MSNELIPGFQKSRQRLSDILYPLLDERVLCLLKINQLQAQNIQIPEELSNALIEIDNQIDIVIKTPTND